jgi:predicted N-formylglutamate amidohydrolase
VTFRFHPGTNLHWLVLCDHASNHVPGELSDLGLTPHELGRHTAWDIGAGDVARRISRGLSAPLIEQGISRLVIDANRGWDDATLIPEISDGTWVPGNQRIDAAEKHRRWRRWHQPYHRRIERHLNQMHGVGLVPFVLSVHSFTPQLGGDEPRPWPIGVLWRHDPTLAHALIRHLGRDGTMVGDNKPYDGHLAMGYTVEFHGIGRALPYTMIELRQDQLATPAARRRWANKIVSALEAVVGHFRRIR